MHVRSTFKYTQINCEDIYGEITHTGLTTFLLLRNLLLRNLFFSVGVRQMYSSQKMNDDFTINNILGSRNYRVVLLACIETA